MTDDSRIHEILASWREARDRGERVDAESVVAAHPDLADTLRARFAALDVLDEMRAAPRVARDTNLRRVEADRYADFRVLGVGGMGIVYWALDTDLNRQVAFKVVRPDAGRGSGATPTAPLGLAPPAGDTPASQAFATLKARFLQEAWVTAGLEHPGIVPVYEVGRTEEGVPYYTMRFVRGSRTLAAAVEKTLGKPIDERLALIEPFLKVCDTIRYAHAHGVIHRDLKPDNVALGEFGEVVVLDWGLAKMMDRPDAAGDSWRRRIDEFREASDLKTLASALGTPGYMSPEAALGRVDEVDATSDVYSLGAMLFEILTGRLPFVFTSYSDLLRELMRGASPEPASLDPSIPAELSQLCVRCLAKNREARPASVDALAAELRDWLRRRERDAQTNALVAEAETTREGMEKETGDALLRRIDRLQGLTARILAIHPDHARASALAQEADGLQERAIAERERVERRRVIRRAGVAALVFLVVAGAVVTKVLDDRRRDAETAHADSLAQRTLAERTSAKLADQLRRTRASALATAAAQAAESDSTLALLLAREAVRLEANPETVSKLHEAVARAVQTAVFHVKGGGPAVADVSPDGKLIATGGGAGSVELWEMNGRRVALAEGHADQVNTVAFSPDGTRLVSASRDGTARLWRSDGTAVAVLTPVGGDVQTASFSPRGDLVVTSCDDGTAHLFDLEGRETAVLRGHEGTIHQASFSPDGTRVLTAGRDGSARVWLTDGVQTAVVRPPEERSISWAAWSPDGERFVTVADQGDVCTWDAGGGLRLRLALCAAAPRFACFIGGHGEIVVHCATGQVRGYDESSAEEIDWAGAGAGVSCTWTIHPGARMLATTKDGNSVWAAFWDGRVLGHRHSPASDVEFRVPGRDPVCLVFSESARRLVTTNDAGEVCIWRTREEEIASIDLGFTHPRLIGNGARVVVDDLQSFEVRLRGPEGGARGRLLAKTQALAAGAVSPDGERIAAVDGEGSIVVWDQMGARVATVATDATTRATIRSLAFSPTGDALLETFHYGAPRVIAFDAGERCRLPETCPDAVFVGPDGGTAGWDSSGRDGVHVFDARGREVNVLARDLAVQSVAASAAGDRILVQGAEKARAPRLFDATSGRLLAAAPDDTYGVAIAPDGRVAHFRWGETCVHVLDRDGRPLPDLVGIFPSVTRIAFAPRNGVLAVVSDAPDVRLYDAQGRPLFVLRDASFRTAPLFAPDGLSIAVRRDGVGLEGRRIDVCCTRTEDLLRLADERAVRDFTREERARFAELLDADAAEPPK